jgi:hypothetical protein
MKKMILIAALMLSTTISFANKQQTVNEKIQNGLKEVSSTLNETKTTLNQVNDLKQELSLTNKNLNLNQVSSLNVTKPTFSKSDTIKPGFLSTTSNGIGTVYGDTKNGVSTLYGDVKSLYPDAKLTIQELYNQIKKVSTYTWNLLVRQQQVWSWCYLVGELLFFFAVFRFWRSYETYKTDKDETGSSKSVNILPIFILGASSLILGYFSLIHFEAMMTGFFNPEFGALKNLVEFGKTLK